MKKLSAIIAAIPAYLLAAQVAFAVTTCPNNDPLCLNVTAPEGRIISPSTPIGAIISFAVAFIIVIAFILALVFVVIGAVQWITSGGDKQKVADARNHIVAAVIGLIIVSLSFVIINVVISALGLGDLAHISIPKLSDFR